MVSRTEGRRLKEQKDRLEAQKRRLKPILEAKRRELPRVVFALERHIQLVNETDNEAELTRLGEVIEHLEAEARMIKLLLGYRPPPGK